jgi:Zn finger protein HypA/HybF involved in hydrogenase expression
MTERVTVNKWHSLTTADGRLLVRADSFWKMVLHGGEFPTEEDEESFRCLMCGKAMRDTGEGWECRCGFFYKPLVPGTSPKKYIRGAPVKAQKRCRECHKVEVTGIRRYCPACLKSRNRKSYQRSKEKSRSRVQKTGFSPVAAEALTKANIACGYGSSGTPHLASLKLDIKEPVP